MSIPSLARRNSPIPQAQPETLRGASNDLECAPWAHLRAAMSAHERHSPWRPLRTTGSLGANDVVGIGVIGLGNISRGHLAEFTANADSRITAVCDIYAPRLDAGVTQTGAKGYRRFEDLLADKDVDAVIICTPDHWHAADGDCRHAGRQGCRCGETHEPHHRRGQADGQDS